MAAQEHVLCDAQVGVGRLEGRECVTVCSEWRTLEGRLVPNIQSMHQLHSGGIELRHRPTEVLMPWAPWLHVLFASRH
jgi:hypothetical protein